MIRQIVNRKLLSSLIVFLLMYYCYLNGVRLISFPFSSISIPLLLAIVLILIFIVNKGKIFFHNRFDKILCITWLIIAIYILLNNNDLQNNFTDGGMIQLYIMVIFLICMSNRTEWIKKWLIWTEIFVLLHAIATVIFFFNSDLYVQFVNSVFTETTITSVLKYYRMGYMCGLSTHFSTNGMILGIGLLIFFERLHFYNNDKKIFVKNIVGAMCYLIGFFLILYAIFLSSKRIDLLGAIISIAITFIIYSKKQLGKRVFISFLLMVGIGVVYLFFVQFIPGLDTISKKFIDLKNSSAGFLNGRSSLWAISIDMINRTPIFGMGYGSYKIIALGVNAITTSAHNFYLQVFSELGIVGLGLYISAFASGILYTIKLLRQISNIKRELFNWDLMVLSISLEIQIFVIIYSFTETSLMYYSLLIPYFLAVTVPKAVNHKFHNWAIFAPDK